MLENAIYSNRLFAMQMFLHVFLHTFLHTFMETFIHTFLNTNVHGNVSTYTVCVKKNATICKICGPLFDKNTHRTYMVCLWICAGSARIRNCGAFCSLYDTAHAFHGGVFLTCFI